MKLHVTVVGVGPVGEAIVSILKERQFPMEWPPTICATSKREQMVDGQMQTVYETSGVALRHADIVLFAGKEGAKGASVQWSQTALDAGAFCIDNGSDFRMDPHVPLVIPEVNMDAVTEKTRLIASPNCSTIQMVVALAPIHREAKIKRIVVSTYQAVSGWGKAAMEELNRQVPVMMENTDGVEFDPKIFAHPIAFNYIPHIDKFTEDGYTKEEYKMVNETRKILGDDSIKITTTTVRVPVVVGHGESINIETEKKLTPDDIRELMRNAPGVTLMDDLNTDNPRNDPNERFYPTPLHVHKKEYRDEVLVGRIREDKTIDNGINLWCVADNLRKGAALNVVQIAEKLVERGLIGKK